MRTYQEVAQTILDQLGKNKFITMTGASCFISSSIENGQLSFRIPKAKNGINYVTITLNSYDTYDMVFMKVRKISKDPYIERKVIQEYNGIYNDQLHELFTEATGLATHL